MSLLLRVFGTGAIVLALSAIGCIGPTDEGTTPTDDQSGQSTPVQGAKGDPGQPGATGPAICFEIARWSHLPYLLKSPLFFV